MKELDARFLSGADAENARGADVYGPGKDDDPTNGGGLPEGSVANAPLSFDFSHSEQRGVQALMWSRVPGVAERTPLAEAAGAPRTPAHVDTVLAAYGVW